MSVREALLYVEVRGGRTIEKMLSEIRSDVSTFEQLIETSAVFATENGFLIKDDTPPTIMISGTEQGHQNITAIVSKEYSMPPVLSLFIVLESFRVVFQPSLVPFVFPRPGAGPKTVEVVLDFFCGSQQTAIELLRNIKSNSVSFTWIGRLTEKYFSAHCGEGMESGTAGLNSDNAVVFIVHPTQAFKEDVLKYLDAEGLQTNNPKESGGGKPDYPLKSTLGCELAVLFRNARFLKRSLQVSVDRILADDGTVYLLLFRETVGSATNGQVSSVGSGKTDQA